MNSLIMYINSISLKFKWIFLSPEERYARLWARTKKLSEIGQPVSANERVSLISNQ
jgi:hypothetical protein